MAQQTEVLDQIFERIAAPVHVVAHSFGGLSALAHALQGQHKPDSLFLVEADERLDFGLLPEPARWDVRNYRPAIIGLATKA